MTNPPQQPEPWGPQDPSGQQNQNPQFGQQPGQPNQQGDAYPQSGPQPQQGWGGTPAQGFGQPAPYGQFDGNQAAGYPSYPGYPGGEPPKKKTGLIVGLSILGLLVVGGIVALILVLTNKNDPAPAGGQATPQALADFLAKAYTSGNSQDIWSTFCPSVGDQGPPQPLVPSSASISGPATNQGATIAIAGPHGPITKNFGFANEGGSWCVNSIQSH